MSVSKALGKCLIITADDYGYSEERDAGIIECFKHGGISSVSVMMNGHSVSNAVHNAAEIGMPMDLHLNLTEGRPVNVKGSKSITDEEGFMLGKMGFRQAVEAGNIDITEVHQEIQAQIDRFYVLTGEQPVKVDGHQHVHVIPGVCEVFATVLEANGIKMSRLPIEDVSDHTWSSQQQRQFMETVVSQSSEAQATLSKHGIWAPQFVGLKTMGVDMTVSHLQSYIIAIFQQRSKDTSMLNTSHSTGLTAAAEGIVCELMVHPGNRTQNHGGCGNGPDDFSKSPDREHEMAVLMCEEMLSFYRHHVISLVAFRDMK